MKQRTFHFAFPVPVHSMHEAPRIFYTTAKVNGDLTKLFVPYVTPITSKGRNFLLMSCIISWSGFVDQMKVKPALYPPELPQKLHVCKRFSAAKRPAPKCGPVQKSQLVTLEIAQQTENFSVEPDQGHSEAQSNAPRVLSGSTSADHAISLIKVGQEGQGTKNDADE